MSLQTDIHEANACISEIFASGNGKKILELYELIGADKEYVIDATEGLAGDDQKEFRRTLRSMKKLAKPDKIPKVKQPSADALRLLQSLIGLTIIPALYEDFGDDVFADKEKFNLLLNALIKLLKFKEK